MPRCGEEIARRNRCSVVIDHTDERFVFDDLTALRDVKMVMARGKLIREPKVKKYENVERELDKFL